MDKLEKFIKLITSIGFVKTDLRYSKYISSDIYIYMDYEINISPKNDLQKNWWEDVDKIWGISKGNIWLFATKPDIENRRKFELENIDILKNIFKSELRNNKIRELGI